MNIAAIKNLNEHMPYWMKRSFARIIRNRLIENEIFSKQYELLEQSDGMTEQEINKLQMDNLKKVLVHAYRHTVYYRGLMESIGFNPDSITSVEELKKFPVLTKELLKENYEKIQADDIDNFYDVTTGGTTGKPTHVLMERDAIYREWAFVYHYWAKFGYDFRTSKLATLRGVNLGKRLSEINPLYREIRLNLFLMNRDNIREYVRATEKYGADFLYGYPSAVYNFCRLAREADISLAGRFRAALLISENLYPFQEEEIAKTLDCPIAMFYGHSERAVFGEKYGEGYIFNPLYGVTEIDEDGSPIVTGFINGKMPLIRYKVDDQVEPIKDHEEVLVTGHWNADILEGKNGEQISAAAINFHDRTLCVWGGGIRPLTYRILGHRERNVLHGKKGEQISVAAINFHDNTFDLVEGYQFVQKAPGYCTLNVLPERLLDDLQIEAIRNNVNSKLGTAVECEVRVVSKLELSPRGKYCMIIQRN